MNYVIVWADRGHIYVVTRAGGESIVLDERDAAAEVGQDRLIDNGADIQRVHDLPNVHFAVRKSVIEVLFGQELK